MYTRKHSNILADFRKDALLQYFDLSEKTFIFVDAHVTGLGAVLAQARSADTARPVEFASRCTNRAEKNYPQMDLEAIWQSTLPYVDFASISLGRPTSSQ